MATPHSHSQSTAFGTDQPRRSEKGYAWLFFHVGGPWKIGLTVSASVIGVGGILYFWYTHSGNDTSPSSPMGLGYAIAGLLLLVLAAVAYSVQRRSRNKVIGRLNAALNWHMFFAVMGLVMLFMHSFGQFEPVSGTYALYGMIALTISGFVGRLLDRLLPRMIAQEVHTVLTAQGDDRIETISQQLEAIVVHNNEKMHGFALSSEAHAAEPAPSQLPTPTKVSMAPRGMTLHAPWDLAYISLEPMQQELDLDAPHHRFIPDKQSVLNRPEALLPGAEERLSALQHVKAAMRREQVYRYIIRYWRILHIILAFVTIGLVIWHLIFAAGILFPGLFPS